MNPDARQFFIDNPDESYWYYTSNIRIPNPKLRRDPLYQPAPWPDVLLPEKA